MARCTSTTVSGTPSAPRPAYALFTPDDAGALVQGFEQYRAGGWVARWSSPGYADLMVGTSSTWLADAYLKGIKGFDPDEAYQPH